VTGTLYLSGSGGAQNPIGGNTSAMIELNGHGPVIKAVNGDGNLWMYAADNLMLGTRLTNTIAIGNTKTADPYTSAVPFRVVAKTQSEVNPLSDIAISGSMSWKARESFTANGTASAYIQIVSADSTAGSFAIEIPSATGSEGQVLLVKDEGGNCAAENVTITTFAAETIDGSSTALLDNNYESVNLYSNGTNWFIW